MSACGPKLVSVVLVVALAAGCGGEPVAELEAKPDDIRLDFARLVPVEFTWHILAPAPGGDRPTVFVHLREEGGAVLRTFDHLFPGDWRVGAKVRDEVRVYQSALGAALPAGSYLLTAGLFVGSKRWELSAPKLALERGEHLVARVLVAEASGVPDFSFSDSWWPEEPGGDAQVLASRWLGGEGTLRVTAPAEAGVLWMRIRLPGPDMAGTASTPDGSPPVLHVASACSVGEANVSGAGTHDLTLPWVAGAAGTSCEVVLRSNSTVPAVAGERPRSALLEVLAWGATESVGTDAGTALAPVAPNGRPR